MAFQSMTWKVTLKPAASSWVLSNSFIGKGCIWPEPEVEIAKVMLHGRQPASFSRAFAFLVLNSYRYGLP